MILAEFGELPFPLVPEFRKAVQKQNQRTLAGADVVEFNAVYFGEMVLELYRMGPPL
jgi:hypothetical protein